MSQGAGKLKKIKNFLKSAYEQKFLTPGTNNLKTETNSNGNWDSEHKFLRWERNKNDAINNVSKAALRVINILDPWFNDPIIGGAIDTIESLLSAAKTTSGVIAHGANLLDTGKWRYDREELLPGLKAFGEDGFAGLIDHFGNKFDDINEQNQKPYNLINKVKNMNPGDRQNLTRPTARVYSGRPQKPLTTVTRPKWKK